MEAARLRVKDLDLERCEILVRDGKGAKDRVTMLPSSLVDPLRAHLAFFRSYLTDLVATLNSAHADGAGPDEMKKGIPDDDPMHRSRRVLLQAPG